MSVEAAASRSPLLATQTDTPIMPLGDDASVQAYPPTIKDGQGRVYALQHDPITAHPQYVHASDQRDASGSSLALEILIDLAPDGSYTRRTSQNLQLSTGDTQREVLLASFGPDGTQVGERVNSERRQGSALSTERTVGTYAGGALVHRETNIDQIDEATDPLTKARTVVSAKIHGIWDEHGAPITGATVPTVDRTETQKIITPGEGINKDTDRELTFTRHGAGPLGALSWDPHGSIVVRFGGHKGQYIEREMRVPLAPGSGEPIMSKAETIRTDDKQNLVNKGLMKARVWGGLASNLSWVAGIRFATGGMSKALLGVSVAASGAQLAGESHALITKRNDGSVTRLAMSAYDTLLSGMLAAFMTGRPGAVARTLPSNQLGIAALALPSIAANSAELIGVANPIGMRGLSAGLAGAGVGASLAQPAASMPLSSPWRMEPRFDAARALLAA